MIYGHHNEFKYTNKTCWKSSNGTGPLGTKFHHSGLGFHLIAIEQRDSEDMKERGVTIYVQSSDFKILYRLSFKMEPLEKIKPQKNGFWA